MDESLSSEQRLMEQAVVLFQEQKKRRMEGKEFNAFEVCRIGSEETRHSAIIAALLDPRGTHGLGGKSLKIFLKEAGLPEFAEYCNDCEVQTEVKICAGTCTENRERRMDIVISGHDLCVVIENKTGTVDHYKQLADYRNWLDNQKVSYKALLYLTYNGSDASDENISEGDYIRISYKDTLQHWLLLCEHEAAALSPKISTFFGQYADFIKNELITEGKTMNQQEWDDLLSSPENFFAAREIVSRFGVVQNEKFINLFNEWAQDNTRQVKKKWKRLLTSDKIYEQLTFDSERQDLLIAFEFASYGFRNFSYGLEWINEKSKDEDHPEFTAIEGWAKAPMWPYYKYFTGDYLNPIYCPDFLLSRKEELYRALDTAYLEMQNLVAKISQADSSK